jgi:hypothetical protein
VNTKTVANFISSPHEISLNRRVRYFETVQDVRLSSLLIGRAKRFTRDVTSTTNYKDSRQSNIAKIEQDHFISKLGEEAVKLAFEKFGKAINGPDYTIYKSKQKTWEADLFVEGVPLAVKTQSTEAAKKYGLSWTFQAGSKRRDPVLKNPEAWVCFVELMSFSMAAVYPPYQIKDLKFREPKLEKLKGSKLVVYAEDLLEVTRSVTLQSG